VDHLFWPHPIDEPMTTLAVAATATTRTRLGTCVLQLPLRQPAVVAKQATALQRLAAGRFVLGLGVGSHPEEYRRAGADFGGRGAAMDDALVRLHDAWSSPGAFDYLQEPRATPIPLWFGGSSRAAIRRTARLGDGWIPVFVTPEEYATSLAALRDETGVAGRSPDAVEPAVVVFACVGEDAEAPAQGAAWLSELYRIPAKAFRRHLVAGTPESCATQLCRYEEAGARHIVVMVAGAPALDHFTLLRQAFAAAGQRVLTGAPT
jgi:alkanesulfonate monooxygenase SsuD/methylene tetrahydromethanopterin reductase-like flavin-dependent oxidoreductase (luciferase family)